MSKIANEIMTSSQAEAIMKNKAETVQQLAARMMVYADLTRCFYYPDKEFLSILDSGEMARHLPMYNLLGIDLSVYLDKMKQWRQSYPGDKALLELQKAYTRLFINAYPRVPAPPYGSLYLEKDSMIWGKSTREAVKLYMEAGLRVAEDFKDIPDHFAAEVEFMWYLIWEELKARGMGEKKPDEQRASKMSTIQGRFLLDHLLKWSPLFLQKVISAGSAFYTEVACLSRDFIDSEARRKISRC